MTNQNLLPAYLIPLIPMIDGDAFLGAFCGAVLYVASSPESSLIKRITYMFVSFMIGYSFAPFFSSKLNIGHHGVPAFIISTFLIVIFLAIVDKINTGELIDMIRVRIGK